MAQPVTKFYSDQCFVCGKENPVGFQAAFLSDGTQVWADVTPAPHTRGFGGVVHGGLVGTLLDEAMFYAVYAAGYTTMTVHMNVTLRKSAVPGVPLHVTGRFVGQDRRYFLAEATLRDPDGALLAEAEGRFLRVHKIEAHLQGAIISEPVL